MWALIIPIHFKNMSNATSAISKKNTNYLIDDARSFRQAVFLPLHQVEYNRERFPFNTCCCDKKYAKPAPTIATLNFRVKSFDNIDMLWFANMKFIQPAGQFAVVRLHTSNGLKV